MRACVQRVTHASVVVAGVEIGAIDQGLLVLLGVGHNDTEAAAQSMAEKIVALRIFEDAEGKMNRSLIDSGGALLAVSQFTLYGDCRKGRRPSFIKAAPPDLGERLYQHFVTAVSGQGVPVQTGRFRADMQVSLINDGPVTMLLDSEKVF